MEKPTIGIFEKNAAERDLRKKFDEEYEKRGKMAFEYGEFEYVDITPENKIGKDVFIATGTPWSWELTKEFAFQAYKMGHRVMAIQHPDCKGYQPETHRPLAIKTFFQNKNLENTVIISHSFGFIDTARLFQKGQENTDSRDKIDGIIAINPAGISENSPIQHFFNSLKNIKVALSGSARKEEKWMNKEIMKALRNQSFSKTLKEIIDVGVSDFTKKVRGCKKKLIIYRNTADSLVPISKVKDENFRKLEGGNHLEVFSNKEQMEEIIKAVKEIENS